ncbi:FKBP-type peptidyl-prolyl cis-trans isomerase N-terminal domain-containing protein [Lysobacter fragariae]
MKSLVRGTAVLIASAAMLSAAATLSAWAAPKASNAKPATQEKTVLTTDRDKASYMVGTDIARSIAPVGPDLDMAAFERAIRNAFEGGKPLLTQEEAATTGKALMARIGARNNQAAGGALPDVAKDKVGLLVGGDVGRSLVSIKEEIDLSTLLQAVRTSMAGGKLLLSDAEITAVRESFSKQIQEKMTAKQTAAAGKNKADGDAFLAKNKAEKGVFTTASGLQYMVLRQGNGPHPRPVDKVRVNYHGTLLDGTVFDSSYDRGQPVEFPLNQVIPGWTEGVALMPVGAKYRFWIPGELAYGAGGTPDGKIGPNSTLVFDVELMAILP